MITKEELTEIIRIGVVKHALNRGLDDITDLHSSEFDTAAACVANITWEALAQEFEPLVVC